MLLQQRHLHCKDAPALLLAVPAAAAPDAAAPAPATPAAAAAATVVYWLVFISSVCFGSVLVLYNAKLVYCQLLNIRYTL